MERFVSERAGIGYSELIRDQRLGFPTVKVKAEFISPIVYGDEIYIEVKVEAIGNSSFTLTYLITRALDQSVCAKIEQVHVAMQMDTRRSVTLPSNLRAQFSLQ